MSNGGQYKDGKRVSGTQPAKIRTHAEKVKAANPAPASSGKSKTKTEVNKDEVQS